MSWRMISPFSIPDKLGHDAVVAFLRSTGHDCLAAHLHKIRISSYPMCPLCNYGEVMDRDHLLRYGALRKPSKVSRYWEAKALLGQ
ncbi:uncharacterized protein NPIL_575891 [Nephila pilipes]|uniref:Uncharacterized protein n=1 Tax=Nephila pilipes TaxID=299642 RepID=A0A8X6Q822_NEPPI|nr:uncharacterized protein NPIL_575891 [Nephila pilipes]